MFQPYLATRRRRRSGSISDCRHHRRKHQQLLLLLLWLAACLTQTKAAAISDNRLSLTRTERILQRGKIVRLADALNRQLLFNLHSNSLEQLSILSDQEETPAILFATVTPCLSSVSIKFTQGLMGTGGKISPINSTLINNHLLMSSSDLTSYDREQLTLNRSITYKLITAGTNSLQLRLKRLYQQGSTSASKVLIKLSTFYPGVELGSGKYKLHICAANSSRPHLVRVKMSHVLSIDSRHESAYSICVVINTVGPLYEFCDAQISLGGDQLPFQRSTLFDGLSSSTRLPNGTHAFTCVNYSSLWRSYPTVDISQLLRRNPQKLYVNAYIMKSDDDGQADATAWETLVYYRTDPQKGSTMNIVNCDSQFTGEGEVALSPNAESQPTGSYSAEFTLQLPPNASLLVRPTRLDLLAPMLTAELTPYSGQSMSMERLANKLNCSGGDEIWAYGGVICGGAGRHICVSGDADACRYDTFRVRLLVQRKLLNGSRRAHGYEDLDSWGGVPYVKRVTVQWQFVQPGPLPDQIMPAIGRVKDALRHLKNGVTQAEAMMRRQHNSNKIRSYNSLKEDKKFTRKFKRKEAVLQACKETLRQTQFADATDKLIRLSVKCQHQLLKSHLSTEKRRSGLFIEEFTDVNFNVQIESPATSSFAAVYSPLVNRFRCLVFRVQLSDPFATKLTKLMTDSFNQRMKHRRRSTKKVYRLVKKLIETRLLATLSMTELPTNARQGFVKFIPRTNGTQSAMRPISTRPQRRSFGRRRRRRPLRHRQRRFRKRLKKFLKRHTMLQDVISELQLEFDSFNKSLSDSLSGSRTPNSEATGWTPRFSMDLKTDPINPLPMEYLAVYVYAAPVSRLSRPGPHRRPYSLFGFKIDGYISSAKLRRM
ncbi:hypothetical protein BOX15_Mlig003440g1 [Macrostomum lignano]|uniref:Uncharacterized protein n=1 Tax=Macrostomum lignano TaxID=282301 RepID=A0A267GCS5_9PLAT|nr:hypothetical protein BOX15_Mlig003440g1 [Macrostomum lignano]